MAIITHQNWWTEKTCRRTRTCNPRRSTKNLGLPTKSKRKWSFYFLQSVWMMTTTVLWKSRRTSSVTTAMELIGAATTSSDIYLHTQGKSHMLVMRVTCGSFSVTTWTDTRGCTAERSRTSAIAAIRTSHGQTGCWGTDGSAQWGWAKRKASTRRTHLPIQPPGAPSSLPTTVWLSDLPDTPIEHNSLNLRNFEHYCNLKTAQLKHNQSLLCSHQLMRSSWIVDFLYFFIYCYGHDTRQKGDSLFIVVDNRLRWQTCPRIWKVLGYFWFCCQEILQSAPQLPITTHGQFTKGHKHKTM